MKLKCRLADESYKYEYGMNLFDHRKMFEHSSIFLVTGRRDWAAFQVLIEGGEEFTVSVGRRPVFSPGGPLLNVRLSCQLDRLENAAVKMYPVGFIEDDDRIFKADLLLHDEVVYVDKGKVQPVWVEILIPEDAAPGIYKGSVDIYAQSMFEDEKKIKSLFFELEVKDVVLPEPRDYHFHLDLWQHLSNIARKHEVHLWSDEHFDVIEEYVKSLAELGQKSVTVIASEIPWSGQRCFRVKNYPSDLFEYNMVRVERDERGEY